MHSKVNNKKNIIKYLIALIPLVLYGLYKNGFLLYQRNLIGLFGLLKPLLIIIVSILINAGVEFIFTKKIKIDYSYLNVVILALFMPPSINLLIYILVLFGGLFLVNVLNKRFKFNNIAFLKLLVIIGVLIFSKYTYLNSAEELNIYAYNVFDMIFGRNVGGINSTNIFLSLIIYSYLSYDCIYKRSIPLISYLVYLGVNLVVMLIGNNINYDLIFSSTVILSFIFVATDNISSPYTFKGQVIYAILLGIITAGLTFALPFEGVFIAIFIVSLISKIIDKVVIKLRS